MNAPEPHTIRAVDVLPGYLMIWYADGTYEKKANPPQEFN